jgi:ribosomal protein S18 acetylase RimI-like enzyme
VQVSKELELAAACRLVSQSNPDVEAAAKRLVASAPSHGIDLSLIWVTLEPGKGRKPRVRQACLPVQGAGRTAMLFVSEPAPEGDGDARQALRERVAVIDAACEHLGRTHGDRVQIAQALPDPVEVWSIEAFVVAGFVKVGDLSYLRREAGTLPRPAPAPGAKGRSVRPDSAPDLGPGLTLTRVSELPKGSHEDVLVEALDRTYIDTLDCPELCGLRETRDVLDSHRDTGQYDPKLWWLIALDGVPHGCAFFSLCPDVRAAELVYLGLSPDLRGKGLGRKLLRMGIEEVRRERPAWPMTLAVDHRNTPARRLYESLGFRPFGERVAFVRRTVT